MAKTPMAKREEERDLTRRALIKWTVAAGAALGVSRGKIVEILEKTAGKETAFIAAGAESASTRSVHIAAGNGGLSHFTLLFPQVDIVNANDPNLSFQNPGDPGNKLIAGTDRPYMVSKDSPWASLPAAKQFTGFVCGQSQAHTNDPQTTVATIGGNNLFAFATSLQASTPAVIPVIAINGLTIGAAPGAAQATAVGDATQVVSLFNSAASRAGGLLAKSQDATTYAVQYAAFAQLNRAANRSTTKISYDTAVGAAGLLGTNLAAKLAIQAADLTRYGVTGSTPNNVKAIANGLIVAVKAFSMGLTNSIVMPAMNDDPHTAFADGRSASIPPQLKTILDAFMTDLQNTTDSVSNQVLSDDTVITISGDTPKDTTSHAGGNWGDGTPSGSNLVFVYGAGHLKTGWFGSIDRAGKVMGYDAAANPVTYSTTGTAKFALASIAYAIAKGDERAIAPFANGVAISGIFGVPKDI
jgi:hypothetical protein